MEKNPFEEGAAWVSEINIFLFLFAFYFFFFYSLSNLLSFVEER